MVERRRTATPRPRASRARAAEPAPELMPELMPEVALPPMEMPTTPLAPIGRPELGAGDMDLDRPRSAEQLRFDMLFDALPDIEFRDQRDSMERPLVSLSKNKRTEKIEYKFDDDIYVRVIPNPEYGWATIWDYDVVLYLLGQINERIERGDWAERPAIRIHPREILTGLQRGVSGRDYADLRGAISRLQSTLIETNVWHGKKLKRFTRFSLIQFFQETDPTAEGSGGMLLSLPEWMVKSVQTRQGILSIHPEYFQISGGIERFLYRFARKRAGNQKLGAKISMAKLHEASGSPMRLSDFAIRIRRIVERNEIPQYHLRIYRNDDNQEIVEMRPRALMGPSE